MQDTTPETVGFRLSPQQEQLLSSSEPGAVSQCAVLVDGPVDADRLRAALQRVVSHHEILRTTLAQPAGMRTRQQVIADELAPAWQVLEHDAGALESLLESERRVEFDLMQGPLVRALLLAPSSGRALLALTASAAVADAASLLVVLDEVLEVYGGGGGNEDPIQYADYAQWRHDLIGEEEEEAVRGRAFWRDDAEERPQPPQVLFAAPDATAGATVPVPLHGIDPGALGGAATASGVTVGVFLEAAWHALLARLTGVSELLTASWMDGRGQPDLETAVGPYTQPVPIRTEIQPATTFAEVLDQIRRMRATAARWQDCAGAEELTALTEQAAAGFAHLTLQPGSLVLSAPSSGARLTLALLTGEDGLTGQLVCAAGALAEADARELAERYAVLLAAAVADAAQLVSRLPILLSGERERLIAAAGAGAPRAGGSERAVHHQFEAQAARTPDLPAVDSAGGTLSYGELDAAANRLAHHLRALGAQPGAIVALALERTPNLLVAILAIHKAGGAYLPLNFEHPPARLRHQLDQSAAAVLITEEHLLERMPEFERPILCLERDAEAIEAHPPNALGHEVALEDLAYVMYTSGSTGLPKGVAVTHGNLANYAASIVQRLGTDSFEGLRFGVVSAISTDLGNTCIFPPLTAGGCVHLVSAAASMDADALSRELSGKRLDAVKLTPSHLLALLDTDTPAVLPARWLVVGGEALRWELVERVRALAPECRILNHYGPTETTVGCCSYLVEDRRTDAATVPIGRPLAGAWAYVLDSNLEPVPAGVPGELCIGGAGVARGYVGDPEGGAGRFVDDPLAPGRIYRTGDRARQLRDGAIEFLGRLDEQVKIRGFRIEPGEIESVLVSHPVVRQAAVSAEDDGHGGLRLVAYLATAEAPAVEELERFLAQSLPDYMIPAAFATVSALPFTPSGKVDRKALLGLAQVQNRREAEYVAPRDEIEEQIAEIWRELLGVERVGVLDDFFALGGHSLLATQAIMRIRRLHGDIPLRALLAAPTVASLAEAVRANTANR